MWMERHETCLLLAKRELQASEKLLDVTYRLLEEPKVLMVCAAKVFSSLCNAVKALLLFEAAKKRIPMPNEDVESMLETFKARQTRRYRLSEDYSRIIDEIGGIVEEHRKSPLEFSRNGNLVICNENFEYRLLSYDGLLHYNKKAKLFIKEVESIMQ